MRFALPNGARLSQPQLVQEQEIVRIWAGLAIVALLRHFCHTVLAASTT